MTLNILFERHVTGCDVLQIDVEGLDWQVLRTLDLERYTPAIIQFEMGHLTVRHCTDVASYLDAHGYSLFWPVIGGDAVALRTDVFGLA